MLSKITHLLITLPTLNTQFIKNLENMFYDFIWCSKTHRVSKNQMIKDYNDSGCRMVHVPSSIKSLKLSWIKRLFNSEATWTHLFFASFKTDLFKLQLFGNSYANLILSKYKNEFWNEVLLILYDFQNINATLDMNNNDILVSPIWYNDKILIGDSPIFKKNLFD